MFLGAAGKKYIHVHINPNNDADYFSETESKVGTSAKEALGAIKNLAMTPSVTKNTRLFQACVKAATKIYQGYEAKYARLNVIQKLFVWLFGSRNEVTAYYSAIQHIANNRPMEGEIHGEYWEKTDGNCAYLTLAREIASEGSLVVDQQILDKAALKLREAAVSWIRENFDKDNGLKSRLSQSIFEHYEAQAGRLLDDIRFYERKMSEGTAYENLSPPLQAKYEEQKRLYDLAVSAFDPSKLVGLVDDYLAETAQPGVFAGAAELYAVGKLHNTMINVYRPNADNQAIRDSLNVIESSDLTDGYNEIRMLRRGSHYNSYYPNSQTLRDVRSKDAD